MNDVSDMWQAINSLHEQAHGRTPLRTCMAEPCRTVTREGQYSYLNPGVPEGPAPVALLNLEDVH